MRFHTQDQSRKIFLFFLGEYTKRIVSMACVHLHKDCKPELVVQDEERDQSLGQSLICGSQTYLNGKSSNRNL